jgi:hypothetical protein
VEISSNEQLLKLFNLILGAFVLCEEKEQYISIILTLENSDQQQLMIMIEKTISNINDILDSSDESEDNDFQIHNNMATKAFEEESDDILYDENDEVEENF